MQRRESKADRGFRQAVYGGDGNGIESVGRKAFTEATDSLRADRFCAVERQPPGAEIEAFEFGIRYLAEAQLVCEVGCRGDRAAVIVNGPKPAPGARQERNRRHQH